MTTYDEAPPGVGRYGASQEDLGKLSSTDDTSALNECGRLRQNLLRMFWVLAKSIHLDDPAPYCFGLAVAISTYLDGDPLWGMIVGPPSGGKTEVIKLIEDMAGEHVDSLTAPSLLSYHHASPRSQPRPAGILVRVGERGFITIADFSTVLSDSNNTRRADLFSALRRVFDGELQRDLGNEDKPLHWTGRVTLLACCTSAIDNYASHSDSLGPRWVYLRLAGRDETVKRTILRKARKTANTGLRVAARNLATRLIADAVDIALLVDLSDEVAEAVDDAAVLAAHGRGSVPRDYKREIDGPPETEEPTRIAKQLAMLCRCLLAIGLTEDEALSLTCRVALDSIPRTRAEVLKQIARIDGPTTASTIARVLCWDAKTVGRALEDFECLGLIDSATDEAQDVWEKAGQGAATPHPYKLSEHQARLVRSVVAYAARPILPELAAQTQDKVSIQLSTPL